MRRIISFCDQTLFYKVETKYLSISEKNLKKACMCNTSKNETHNNIFFNQIKQ